MEGQRRPARFETKACAICGEAFRSWTPMKKYCSPACRERSNEARSHRRKQPKQPTEEG